MSKTDNFRTLSQSYQLWSSLSTALCGCVNNPQNGNTIFCFVLHFYLERVQTGFSSVTSFFCFAEENQHICVAAFPIVKVWLQQTSLHCTEVFQPLCSFIAMTVAVNCKWIYICNFNQNINAKAIEFLKPVCLIFLHFLVVSFFAASVQESFFACGGLETLTLVLIHAASAADTSLLSCKLSIVLAKTLSACITDNCTHCSWTHAFTTNNMSLYSNGFSCFQWFWHQLWLSIA